MRLVFATTVALLGTFLLIDARPRVLAQSGSRTQPNRSAPPAGQARRNTTRDPVDSQQSFEVRFWNWLQAAQYRNWSPLPGQTADAFAGKSPHGAQVKVYVNRTAVSEPQQMPSGAALVKENYGEDGQTLMAVTVMYRSEGYDPENGDWYWVKYEPDGGVSRMDGMAVAGRVQMCADCHAGAQGGDYVFGND
jgi:hypothetical protein